MHRKVVVAGALGLVGRAVVEHFADGSTDWEVVGLSRRAPDFESSARFVGVDLRDASASRAALAEHADATHIVYAALFEKPSLARGWFEADHLEINRGMLANLLDALASPGLRHVTLLQGTKAYGAHLGRRVALPARERDPRVEHANFYFAQEDLLRERAERGDFGWTVLRPQVVCGVSVGSAMNVVAGLGAYAVLCRERGRPLVHPGHADLLTECTDARLLARAVAWAASNPKAWGEIYNVCNGDVLCWRDAWPRIAAHFRLPVGETLAFSLAEAMPGEEALWRDLARREGLRVESLEALVGLSWQYADMIWANPVAAARPTLVSGIKLREHGFPDCIDSEDSLIELLEAMQVSGYLPR